MREIQYRGKRIDTDEWTTGSLIVTHNRHYGITTMTKYDATCEDRFKKIDAIIDEVYPESVGQFTGRKDKKGKMIYEGDIIKNEYEVGEVVWDEERGSFIVDTDLPKPLGLFLCYPSKIIGNKYDNPKVLES